MLGPGALIAASVIPSVVGAISEHSSAKRLAAGQDRANIMSRDMAREQMAFQREMSNTAHQREVEDLRRAGLNPALSANAGASTPVGASAEFKNAAPDTRGIVKSAALGAVGSALELRRLKSEIDEIDSRADLNRANKRSVETNIGVKAPFSEIGTKGAEVIRRFPEILNRLRLMGRTFFDEQKYISSAEQHERARQYLGKGLSPRGKNVPLRWID